MTVSRDERLPGLYPFLEGWFFIASCKTIEKAKIITAPQKAERIDGFAGHSIWSNSRRQVGMASS